MTSAIFLGHLTDRWLNFDNYESAKTLGPQGELPPWNLWVQQQLGLVEIRPLPSRRRRELKGWGGKGWLAGGARLTPWGTAVTWALLDFWKVQSEAEDEAETKDTDEQTDEWTDDASAQEQFGILQPVFQPFFPEWRTNYRPPPKEVRLGTHTFKVRLAGWRGADGSIWRRLLVPGHASLDTLAQDILSAFEFDNDHSYDFRYRDQRGKSRVYNHPWSDREPSTLDISVAETELGIKEKMLFTFDYGDNWQFEVRLESVDEGSCQLQVTKVIDSAGEAPKQYPPYES
jgi:hypothetical protein